MEEGQRTSGGTNTQETPVQSTNKYGSLMPKKSAVHQQQQYFDSADWQMNRKNRGEGTEASRLKPAYKMSPSKSGVTRGKSKLSSTSLSDTTS